MLPACPAVVDLICYLLAHRRQFEELLFARGVFGGFGKLPVFFRLLSEII